MTRPSNEFGPFRATALWNEAVTCFRDGISLSDHRHRFHKHKNSFTGCEAVRFLHKCLQTNKLFNPNVTREQTKQLLNQFLSAELICPAKECNWSSKERFRDSSKYFYQFTEKLIMFDGSTSLSSATNRSSEYVLTSATNKDSRDENLQFAEDNQWKILLLTRLKRVLRPFDVGDFIHPEKIESKWVVTNASPQWVKMRWNTELPHWILSAIHTLLSCAFKTGEKATYPEFEIELFHVISDYFATLESPLISCHLFTLVVQIYLHFESQIRLPEDALKSKITASQENLMELISSPVSKPVTTARSKIPDSCFETMFTSDDPVVRMIPQRSYDIVHLKRYPSFSHYINTYPVHGTMQNRRQGERKPLQIISNTQDKKYDGTYKKKSKEIGIDNAAFSYSSPTLKVNEQLISKMSTTTLLNSQTNPLKFGRYMRSKSSSELDSIHVYENQGMNDTLGDPLNYDHALDYELALESVDRLLKASCSRKSSSSQDTINTFYTASTSSNIDLDETHAYENIETKELSSIVSSSKEWPQSVTRMCASTFHLVFLFLPPGNRAQLRQLMRLLSHVPKSIHVQELSFSQMACQLLPVIFKPPVEHYPDGYDEELLLSIVQFVSTNHEEIFSDLPPTVINEIQSKISSAKMKLVEWIYKRKVAPLRARPSTIVRNTDGHFQRKTLNLVPSVRNKSSLLQENTNQGTYAYKAS